MGVNLIKNIKIWLFQKVEKSHSIKFIKFEVESLKLKISFEVDFCSKKSGTGWVDGWTQLMTQSYLSYTPKALYTLHIYFLVFATFHSMYFTCLQKNCKTKVRK